MRTCKRKAIRKGVHRESERDGDRLSVAKRVKACRNYLRGRDQG